MENTIKGTSTVFKLVSGTKTITFYGILPEGWKMESEKEMVIISKNDWEINLMLLRIDKSDSAHRSQSKIWFANLLSDFIPDDYNYDEIHLSSFAIPGLNDAYSYSAETVKQKEMLREDLILTDKETPLRVKGLINKDEYADVFENFVLSLRYKPYDKEEAV